MLKSASIVSIMSSPSIIRVFKGLIASLIRYLVPKGMVTFEPAAGTEPESQLLESDQSRVETALYGSFSVFIIEL